MTVEAMEGIETLHGITMEDVEGVETLHGITMENVEVDEALRRITVEDVEVLQRRSVGSLWRTWRPFTRRSVGSLWNSSLGNRHLSGIAGPAQPARCRNCEQRLARRAFPHSRAGLKLARLSSVVAVQRSAVIERILGCAIAVHRALGPGLLESTYQQCLSYELALNRVAFRSQVPIPVVYRGTEVRCGYRADFIVEDTVLVEIKSVDHLLPLHDAQVLTYLKLTGLPRGLLMNFNVPVLKSGVKSFLNSRAAQPERDPGTDREPGS